MMKKCDNRLPSCLTPEERKAPDVCAYPKTHKDAPAPAFVRHTHTHTHKNTLNHAWIQSAKDATFTPHQVESRMKQRQQKKKGTRQDSVVSEIQSEDKS